MADRRAEHVQWPTGNRDGHVPPRWIEEANLRDFYSDAVVRLLEVNDWLAWADVARRAVTSDPEAFSTSTNDLDRMTEADWQLYTGRYCTPTTAAFVDEREGTFFAMVGVERSGSKAVVTILWVSPEGRRCGLGQALMAAAESWAVEHSATELLLTVTPRLDAAIRFYLSAGFEATNPAETPFTKALIDP